MTAGAPSTQHAVGSKEPDHSCGWFRHVLDEAIQDVMGLPFACSAPDSDSTYTQYAQRLAYSIGVGERPSS
uniref:Uncharacterized protein n=1 Tax=Mycena chlorophos TaxID=658473 RepID=A0ABQ0LV15_MYCCL|nr:predicted protein [Mycena chlorophos]